jgi:hypothetical protein
VTASSAATVAPVWCSASAHRTPEDRCTRRRRRDRSRRALHVFHIPYPGESHDALRVTVTPAQGSYMEVLAYEFPVVGPDSATLELHWGTTIVPQRIRTKS